MKGRITPRELTKDEYVLLQWLIRKCEKKVDDYLGQLKTVTVIDECSCGCPSIFFKAGDIVPMDLYCQEEDEDEILDMAMRIDGKLIGGVYITTRGGLLSDMCVYSWLDEPPPLPSPEDLLPWDDIDGNSLFHPRDFSYTAMPENWEKLDFDGYCEWLLDYLLTINAPIPECQKRTWETLSIKKPFFAARVLGDHACYHTQYYVEPFDYDNELPKSYEAVYNVLKEQHEDVYADEDDPDCCDKLEDWINPAIWANILREYKEYGRISADKVDMGYRIILSKLVTKADTRKKQLGILEDFFQSFTDSYLK